MKVESSLLSKQINNLKVKQAVIVLLGAIISALSIIFAFLIESLIETAFVSGVNDNKFVLATVNSAINISLIFVFSVVNNLLCEKFKLDAEISVKKFVVKSYVQKCYNENEVATGDMLTRIESEAVSYASYKVLALPKIITAVIRLVMIIASVFFINVTFAIIVLVSGVMVVLATLLIRKITVKLYKKTSVKNAIVSSYLTEVDENLLTVKGLRVESKVESVFNEKLVDYEKAKKNQRYFQAGFSSLIPFAFNLTFLVAVILSKEYVYGVVAIVQLIMQARSPITSFASLLSAYYEISVTEERLLEITGDAKTYQEGLGEFEKLEVDNVTFAYGEDSVLSNLSFAVNKGEKVAIKGKTGAGKTTLIKLLTGAYKVENGEVNYFYEFGSVSAYSVKNAFSVAYQDSAIFSGTLKDNLILSNQNATETEIENAINFALLNDVVTSVGGINGYVGERGETLSEGQRQRLAIARAYISNANVIILDEPTSALDDITKTALIDNITASEKTFIIVSHDEKVIEKASKVIEIK